MKILLIGTAVEEITNKNAYHMYKNMKERGIDVVWITKHDILYTEINLRSFDKIICWDTESIPAIDAILNSLPNVYNKPSQTNIVIDKWNTYYYFKDIVEQPLTYFDHIHNLEFPLVIKDRYGSLGSQVYVVYDHYELDKISDIVIQDHINRHTLHPVNDILIYQEIIGTSWGRDLRVVLIGGKYVACELRQNNSGAIQSNLAQGGESFVYDITPEQIQLCEFIAQQLKLDYVGIDMLFGEMDGELLLCEANACAFFDGITAVTGIDICDKYTEYILNTEHSIKE